jgi:Arc/MetJ-type ribon-helix-helix transcriptional regulator
MTTTVQARLDEETQAALDRLRQSGLRTSEVIRKGIHMVAKEAGANKEIEIVGFGQYDSGIRDLSTNKKHMAGFGGHSRIKAKPVQKSKAQ